MSDLRMWRTLVRVLHRDAEIVRVVVPGWDPNAPVDIKAESIPPLILKLMEPGKRLHTRVSLGARSASGLSFDNWEDV